MQLRSHCKGSVPDTGERVLLPHGWALGILEIPAAVLAAWFCLQVWVKLLNLPAALDTWHLDTCVEPIAHECVGPSRSGRRSCAA